MAHRPRIDSPFDAVIALGYHDGPEDGMVRCGSCGREYRFRVLDSRIDPEDETETRIFGLSPIPTGSIAHFSSAMSRYQGVRSPDWVPLWSFPTDEDRAQMEDLVDQIFEKEKPVELILASSPWPSGDVNALRSISPSEIVPGKDWFFELGLIPASA